MSFNGWKRKCALTISHNAIDSDLSNFPWLFTKTNLPLEMFDADGGNAALNGGGDIRFSSDSDGNNRLACEIVTFVTDNDPNNGKAEIWVKIPFLSSVNDTVIYVWYGKEGETQPNRNDSYGSEEVWSDNFAAVYHFNQNPTASNLIDSTVNHNDAVQQGGFDTDDFIDALYGKGVNFDGNTNTNENYLATDNSSLRPTSLTLEMIASIDASNVSYAKYIHKGDSSVNPYGAYMLQKSSSDNQKMEIQVGTTTFRRSISNVFQFNTYYHFAGTYSSEDYYTRFYRNGALEDADYHGAGTLYYDSNPLGIGREGYRPTPTDFPEMKVEEIRIHSVARSAAWIAASYRCQFLISSYTTVGTPQSNPLYVELTGISSAESFGNLSLQINQFISPIGIDCIEEFGYPVLIASKTVSLEGIPGQEAFGNAFIYAGKYIWLNGISSGEQFGLIIFARGSVNLQLIGLPSEEAFGLFTIDVGNVDVNLLSIPSEEVFGAPNLLLEVAVVSVSSGEEFGLLSIVPGNININLLSILSEEVFGVLSVNVGNAFSQVLSIESEEAFGYVNIHTFTTLSVFGISSEESFGLSNVNVGSVNVSLIGINSEEDFGSPSLLVGSTYISLLGIASFETFGLVSCFAGTVNILVNDISSEEVFGNLEVQTGSVNIYSLGISSAEAFGSITFTVGVVNIEPTGISSEEVFGAVSFVSNIKILSIDSVEEFGLFTLETGNITVYPNSIQSLESFGFCIVRNVLVIEFQAYGIGSLENFGNPFVVSVITNDFQKLMERDLSEGVFNLKEFAENAVYIHKEGTVLQIPVIFDSEYELVDVSSNVISKAPVVYTQGSLFKIAPEIGDKIVIRGVNYEIITYEPDGTGVVAFRLHTERTV